MRNPRSSGSFACADKETAQLLGRYEFGSLSEEERVRFESHALACNACFAALERASVVVTEMRARSEELLRLLDEEARQRGKVPFSLSRLLPRLGALSKPLARRWVAVPLAIVVIGIGLGGLLRVFESRDLSDLATFPREEIAATMVRGPVVTDPVRELMETGAAYFDLKRYDEAERWFRAALEREPTLAEAAYLLGLSRALAGDADGAIPLLEQATRLARGDLEEKASWALANAYLKARRTEDARRALVALASRDGERAPQARALLERIGP